jgi:F-type H+-transporting ATPase subunit gamma
MKSSNEIKTRIKSIKDTSQITKAMQLISVAKMRKALIKYEANKSYNNLLKKAIIDIFSSNEEFVNPYAVKRQGNRVAYIVIASDKGMAGDYNHKVLDLAYDDMKNVKEKFVFTIGHIAYDYFAHKGINVDIEYLHIIDNPNLSDARKIMYNILDLYDRGMMDEIKIVYTTMITNSDIKPIIQKLLPLKNKDEYLDELKEQNIEYQNNNFEFNDKLKEVIDTVVEQYILGTIYSALIQSVVAEHFKRMVAMDSATRNSKEILEKLSLEYNKLRQEKITTEIIETSVSMLRKE